MLLTATFYAVDVWPAWVGGIAIGLYGLTQLTLTGNPLGASTGYGNLCSLFSKCDFFHTGAYETANNWRLWFLIGLPLGGLIAFATSSGQDIGQWVPHFDMDLYDSIYRSTPVKLAALLAGGVLIGYGARLAGGCQSGHAITGIALLNPASVIAGAGFFAGGIIAVQLLFKLVGPIG